MPPHAQGCSPAVCVLEDLFCPEGCSFRVRPLNVAGWDAAPSLPSAPVSTVSLQPAPSKALRLHVHLEGGADDATAEGLEDDGGGATGGVGEAATGGVGEAATDASSLHSSAVANLERVWLVARLAHVLGLAPSRLALVDVARRSLVIDILAEADVDSAYDDAAGADDGVRDTPEGAADVEATPAAAATAPPLTTAAALGGAGARS